MNHQIEAPAREEETQYSSGNKQVVYLAVDNALAAMLVLTYTADRRRKNELQRLEDSGVSVVIRTNDMNVTPQLVSRLFGVDAASVGVLGSQLSEVGRKLMSGSIPRADAKVATKGRVESLMSVVSACVHERRSMGLIAVSYTHLDVYKRQVHMDCCFKVLAKTYFPGPLPAKYLRHERA